MSITVAKAGILDTLQDQGRYGFSKWGINTNGAMDWFAMCTANALVGNDLDATILEMHFPAAEIVFSTPALISVTGADFSPAINEMPIQPWKTIQIQSGSVLRFKKKVNGMRCYLAVHGGFNRAPWLGSGSTNLKSRTGGYEGRPLTKNDVVVLGEGPITSRLVNETTVYPWRANSTQVYRDDTPLGITIGNEWSWLTESSQEQLLSRDLSVGTSSDRMASFLISEPMRFNKTDQLLSSAVTVGTIQALPSGKLCVLMADHQTTGGYPRVAHIASAHLPRFAQLSPNERFTFTKISIGEAEKMLFSLKAFIMMQASAVKEKLFDRYAFH